MSEAKYPYPDWIEQGFDLLEPRKPYSDELRAAIDKVEQDFENEDVELVSIEHQVYVTKTAFEQGYDAALKTDRFPRQKGDSA